MQWWFQELSTGDPGEANPQVATVNIPSTDVLAFCSLQQVGKGLNFGLAQPAFGNAEVFISQYVADGDPHEGNWPLIGANDVTSISVTLSANGADAKGLLLILAINE